MTANASQRARGGSTFALAVRVGMAGTRLAKEGPFEFSGKAGFYKSSPGTVIERCAEDPDPGVGIRALPSYVGMYA